MLKLPITQIFKMKLYQADNSAVLCQYAKRTEFPFISINLLKTSIKLDRDL